MQLSGKAFSPDLGGTMMSLSASTTKNDSNILQYDYKRSDVSLNVSYQMARLDPPVTAHLVAPAYGDQRHQWKLEHQSERASETSRPNRCPV